MRHRTLKEKARCAKTKREYCREKEGRESHRQKIESKVDKEKVGGPKSEKGLREVFGFFLLLFLFFKEKRVIAKGWV